MHAAGIYNKVDFSGFFPAMLKYEVEMLRINAIVMSEYNIGRFFYEYKIDC